MSVFRGDSDTGDVTEPEEAGETDALPRGRATSEASNTSEAGEVTPSAMRRTLARARDGKALDRDEATVLLHARGEDLDTLLGYASRTRDAGLQRQAGRTSLLTPARSSSR